MADTGQSKIIDKALRDPKFKAKLISDPHAALSEAGVTIPSGTKVKVVENTATLHHIVLPVAPSREISEESLEKISGGHQHAFLT